MKIEAILVVFRICVFCYVIAATVSIPSLNPSWGPYASQESRPEVLQFVQENKEDVGVGNIFDSNNELEFEIDPQLGTFDMVHQQNTQGFDLGEDEIWNAWVHNLHSSVFETEERRPKRARFEDNMLVNSESLNMLLEEKPLSPGRSAYLTTEETPLCPQPCTVDFSSNTDPTIHQQFSSSRIPYAEHSMVSSTSNHSPWINIQNCILPSSGPAVQDLTDHSFPTLHKPQPEPYSLYVGHQENLSYSHLNSESFPSSCPSFAALPPHTHDLSALFIHEEKGGFGAGDGEQTSIFSLLPPEESFPAETSFPNLVFAGAKNLQDDCDRKRQRPAERFSSLKTHEAPQSEIPKNISCTHKNYFPKSRAYCKGPTIKSIKINHFLEIEGVLAMAKVEELSEKVAEFLTQIRYQISQKSPMIFKKDGMKQLLETKLERVRHRLIKAFFGGISLLCMDREVSDSGEIMMQGWNFIKQCVELWSSTVLQNPQVLSTYQKLHSRFVSALGIPNDRVMVYFTSLKDRVQYSNESVISLLRTFKNWTEAPERVSTMVFDNDELKKPIKRLCSQRAMFDDWFRPPSNIAAGDSINSQTYLSILDSDGTDSEFGEIQRYKTKGKNFLLGHQDLVEEISHYCHELGYALELSDPYAYTGQTNFFQETPINKMNDGKKPFVNVRLELARNNIISAVEKKIIPTFLGMVKTFLENEGLKFTFIPHGSVEIPLMNIQNDLIFQAWDFIKKNLAMLKNQETEPYSVVTPHSHRGQSSIDWSIKNEVVSYFMRYGMENLPQERYMWYLARQWQEGVVHRTTSMG